MFQEHLDALMTKTASPRSPNLPGAQPPLAETPQLEGVTRTGFIALVPPDTLTAEQELVGPSVCQSDSPFLHCLSASAKSAASTLPVLVPHLSSLSL